MADLDLSSLISDTLNTANRVATTGAQALDITNQLGDMSEAKASMNQDTADAQNTIITADLTAKAQQEATRKNIAARLGTDATQAGWIIGRSSDEIEAADGELKAASADIAAKQSVSFLDSPLGWLSAQLTVGKDYERYNAAARAKNIAEDTAQQRAAMTTAAYQNNDALSSVVTQSYIDASKIVGAHQYNAAAADASMQALRWNLEGIQAASKADTDRLNLLYSGHTAMNQERQYGLEVQKLNLQKQEFDLKKQAFAEKTDEDSLVLKYMQKGFFNLNGRQMDPTRAKDAVLLFKSKQPDALAYFNSGMDSYAISDGGTKSVVSLSPFDASTLVSQNKVQNLPEAQMQVGAKLVEWRRDFESPQVQNQLQLDKKDKTSVERAFNAYVQGQQKQEMLNLPSDSVFAPTDPKQVAAVNPNIENLPIWQKVLAPAAKTGVDLKDPTVAFGLTMNGLTNGTISYSEAQQLSTVYAAGLDLNNQSRNFIAMGLPPVRSYNTKVQIPGQFGKSVINMADQMSVSTAINKASAYTAVRNDPTQDRTFGGKIIADPLFGAQ